MTPLVPTAKASRRLNGKRSRYVLLGALVLSLLLHGLLLGGFSFSLPQLAPALESQPLQARLVPLPPKPLIPPPRAPAHFPSSQKTTTPHAPATTLALAQPAPVAIRPLAPPAAATPAAPAVASPPAQAQPTPGLNPLPAHFELQYRIFLGDQGIPLGHASYVWIADDNRYTLVSITQAEGLLALFQPGSLQQTSTGHVDQSGLVPDDFEIQRGNADKTTRIHIDHNQHIATVSRSDRTFTEPVPDHAQDILSVIFQLALHAPFSQPLLLNVTSGKAFKPYHAIVVGEETIVTPLGKLRTLHLSRPAEDGEDSMDIWLAKDLNFAPVKVRYHESQLGDIVQTIIGME